VAEFTTQVKWCRIVATMGSEVMVTAMIVYNKTSTNEKQTVDNMLSIEDQILQKIIDFCKNKYRKCTDMHVTYLDMYATKIVIHILGKCLQVCFVYM
jgi:hypothetical protein